MKRYSLGLFGAALLVSIAAYAAATCPIDSTSAYFTGQTKTDSATGKLLYQHKCPHGHIFWTTHA